MSPTVGELVTKAFEYDGGRQVTTYVPPAPAEAIVFGGDGHLITSWGRVLEAADLLPTMIIGAHGPDDQEQRIRESSPGESTPAFALTLNDSQHTRGSLSRGFAIPTSTAPLLRITGLWLPTARRDAELTSARVPPRRQAGALLPEERDPMGGRAPRCLRGRCHDRTSRVTGDAFWREEFPLMVAWAFGHSASRSSAVHISGR
jgi:hypothetical protein